MDEAEMAALIAERAGLIAARTRLLSGQAVTHVQRGENRITYAAARLSDLDGAIAGIDARIAAGQLELSGRPRRRAIGVIFHG